MSTCPQPCEHLSAEDAREGKTCPEHPCTCTPEKWQDFVPDVDDPDWYDDRGVRFTGNPTPAQVEAARRFVTRWLHYNEPRFTIPGTEWGQSLLHWIQTLTAAAEPKEEQ